MKLRPFILLGVFLGLFLSLFSSLSSGNMTFAATPSATPISNTSLTQGVKKIVLNNGLTVLTKEVHTAPVVTVQVWYEVGSRNEGKGENGISHQLEHMLFKGTKERPVQFGRLFSALGSQFNAFTSYDETAYFGTVQRDKLQALLTLEADRMQGSVIDTPKLDSEKRVVVSELQGYENSPSYRLSRAVMKAVFPNRQYGLPVGGTKADVEQFTVNQVQEYYKKYYSPDNATLIVVGDFATEPLLKAVNETFAKVPSNNLKVKPSVENKSLENKSPENQTPENQTPENQTPENQTPENKSLENKGIGKKANQPIKKPNSPKPNSPQPNSPQPNSPIILKEPGSATLLNAVYPLVEAKHPDVPAIDLMDAVLTGGRSSRLYQALVETGLAGSIGASPIELLEPGWYEINATAAPGQDIKKIAQVINQTIAGIQEKPVTAAELNRAKTQLQANLILNNQDITSQATQLGYNQIIGGDYRYVENYLAGINKVTPADIQRVAKTYLNQAKQKLGFFIPTQIDGKADTSSGSGRTAEKFNPGKPVDPAELAKYLPAATSAIAPNQQVLPEQFTLPNGLRVLLLPDRSVPSINITGQIAAGTVFDTEAKAGVASLVAGNLMNGTKTKNALAIAQSLDDRGAGLGFSANREGVVIKAQGLSANLPILVQTIADVVQNATFPADQLEVTRQQSLIALKTQLDDPRGLGRREFQKAIYPANHPFRIFPTLESLKNITRQDLVKFYKSYYRPDITTLAFVGDFDPKNVKTLLNQAFSPWKATGKPPVLNLPQATLPKAITRLQKLTPGKSEAVTYIGYRGISRKDPRYYSALVVNQILGGDTLSSRLGTEVRDRQGLTYGIYSAFAAGIYPGPFLIQMQTSPTDTPKAIESTIALLKQLREQGITEAELNTAKRSITNSYPVDLANPSDVAGMVLDNSVFGLSTAELRDFPKRVDAVTMADTQKVIQDLIQPDNLVILTAGP
jgi:zinc protease